MQARSIINAAMIGMLSGLLSYASGLIRWIPEFGFWYGPGLTFGIATSIYFWWRLKRQGLMVQWWWRILVWIAVSVAAYYVAVLITVSLVSGAISASVSFDITVIQKITAFLAGGVVGGGILLLGFWFAIRRASIPQWLAGTALAGVLGVSAVISGDDFNIPLLYIIWQAGMMTFIEFVLEREDVARPVKL